MSPSVILFSSCLQSFPASGSFPVSLLFASSGQSIGASASVISPSNEMCLFNLLCGQREKGEGFSAQFPSWAGFLSSRLIATADKECSLSRCYESGTALARLLSPPDTSISVMGTQARAVKSSCPRSACGSGLYLQPRAIAELGVMRLRFVEGCSD